MIRSIAAPLVPASILAASLAAAGSTLPPLFEPDSAAAEQIVLAGQTWTLEAEEYTIHLRRVDGEERQNFIGGVTGLSVDPFASPEGRGERFLSFLLRIDNRTDGAVQFNPINSWLMTNRKEVQYPIGLTDLSFSYHVAGREFPVSYERVGPALLEQSREILPGQTTSGLLVYHVLDPKTKRFHVDVEVTLANGDLVRFAAPYRRVPSKNRKR